MYLLLPGFRRTVGDFLFMNLRETHANCDLPPVSSERVFPVAPFPRNYVHCVMADLYDVVQAVQALRVAGYDPGDIHVMSCWDYVDAVEQKQRGVLSKVFRRFLSFFDEGFSDAYLQEAMRGNHILVVRLASSEQTKLVRDLLLSHHAYLIKYMDVLMVADLVPSSEYAMR